MLQAKKRTTRPQKKAPKENSSPFTLMKDTAKGMLVTLIAALASLLVCSLIVYFSSDPNKLIYPMGLLCAALTAMIGGFATERFHRHAALICGLLNGTVATGVWLLISFFLKDSAHGYSPLMSLLVHTLYILLAVIGAYLGIPRVKKKKARKKR